MKKTNYFFLLFCIFLTNKGQAQLYNYNVELIKQKVERKLKCQTKTNKHITATNADWISCDGIIWQMKEQQIKLTLTDYGDIVTTQDKFLQKRMILSNAARQEKLKLGDEAYLFSNYENNSGTILVRKANLTFHFSANNLKKTPRLIKIILNTLELIPTPLKSPE